MNNVLQVIRSFADKFCTTDLYDAGYGDIIASCGVRTADTVGDMVRALCFLNGYAQACRLACPYGGRHWQVAHQVSAWAGIVQNALDADVIDDPRRYEVCCNNAEEAIREALAKAA